MCKGFFHRKIAGILVAVLALCGTTLGTAQGGWTDASGRWQYIVEQGGATITGYVGEPPEDIVFPSMLDGYAVRTIARFVEDDCYLRSVTIPEGITHIGSSAFSYYFYGFTSVAFPSSLVSIGDSAFYACDLTSVNIPAGVAHIGRNPFDACPVNQFDVAPSNPVYAQVNGVLFDKQQLMLVAYPGGRRESLYVLPQGILRIGDSAFSESDGLAGVVLPNSVTSIGEMAFYGCTGLTDVTIPGSVREISNAAFAECNNLRSVTFADGISFVADTMFFGCTNLSRVTLPNSVTRIGEMAFGECHALTSLAIPPSVTFIDEAAFLSCYNLVLTVQEGSYAAEYAQRNGIRYQYNAASGVIAPSYTPIEGLTIDNLSTRSGPSTGYNDTGTYRVKGTYVRLISCAYDKNDLCWVQCDIPYGNKLRRVYTGLKRFDTTTFDLSALPVEVPTEERVRVSVTAKAMYGPGTDYATYSDLTLEKGQTVHLIALENGYAQVEWTVDTQRYRAWVSVRAIGR